jgi:uncharacterized low-complexity protein
MRKENKLQKKTGILAGALVSGALLTFSAGSANAASLNDFSTLGSGSQVRTTLLDMNSYTSELAEQAASFDKSAEAKCGENKEKKEGKKAEKKEGKTAKGETCKGKCGEKGKASEAKCGEKGKAGEGKCGEGKCGSSKSK